MAFTRHPEQTRQNTLRVLRQYFDQHGESPTYAELGDMLGINTAAAHRRIRKLVEDGKVEILDGMWRNIILKEKPDGQ